MRKALPVFDLFGWGRRHPFVVASLALHGLLVSALWLAGPRALAQAQQAREAARAGTALQTAQREQVQRHVQRLDKLAKELGAEPPGSAASTPLERAEALTKRLEATEHKARVKELARLLKITPEQAAARVRLEDARRLKPVPHDAAQALAQLEGRARAALERQHAREQREREGLRVAGLPGAGGPETGAGWLGGGGQGGINDGRDYGAAAEVPTIDPATVHIAAGRRLGAGGPYANRVYLDRWHVIGPFPGRNPEALHTVQPPEIAVDLDAVYPGKHGLVGWRPQHSETYPFVPEQVGWQPPKTWPYEPWAEEPYTIYYAATEVHVDRDMAVWLDIGGDDDTRLWLNDELVWTSINRIKPWYLTPYTDLPTQAIYGFVEGRVRVTLRAGRNTLLLKLYNGIGAAHFSVVIAS
ncbi:MAG: hypothetical protein EOP39_19875 [Rubrivivax sp.]|nr:MAG: hypothetical protein EOP39_19875 [Rubrivivax sp.]